MDRSAEHRLGSLKIDSCRAGANEAKTFDWNPADVFGVAHREGDWALRSHSAKPYDASVLPGETAVRGMIARLNARQAGIVKARTKIGPADVHVYGATEANRIEDSMAGRPGVANSVLPYTAVDLVSYSFSTIFEFSSLNVYAAEKS